MCLKCGKCDVLLDSYTNVYPDEEIGEYDDENWCCVCPVCKENTCYDCV